MPTSRPFQRYPEEYQTLFRNAFNKPVRLNFESLAEAQRARFHFYAFRRALRARSAPEDLKIIAPLLTFKITDTDIVVQVRKRLPKLKAEEND